MKKKSIMLLFIISAIILINLLNPKNVKANDEIFSDDITYEWEYFADGPGMPYGIFTPSTADEYEGLPMIVWLHGGGGSAPSENDLKEEQGIIKAMGKGNLENFSAYILIPHMLEYNGYWTDTTAFQTLLDYVIQQYSIDADNIILCGESRGGTGALYMANALPEYFRKCAAFSAFYKGPFNTSMDTLCFYSWYADDAGKPEYVNPLKSAFGTNRVFSDGSGHGSVGASFCGDDGGQLADNRNRSGTEMVVQI